MRDGIERRAIGIALQRPDRAFGGEGRDPLDQFLARLAIGDHVGDGDVLELVGGRKARHLLALHDRAVVVHQLADDADRRQAGELAEIDRGFGMAGAQQHAAVARDQRKHVAGPGEIVGAGIGVGQRPAAGGAFVGRNPGAAIGLVVDRHRKGGGVVGLVVRHHRVEPQPARILAGDRRADDARGVADDERHLLRGAQRRRDDQIALALAVFVIGDDDEFAVGKGLQNFLDRIRPFYQGLALWWRALAGLSKPAPASLRRAERRPRQRRAGSSRQVVKARKTVDEVRSQSPWSP